MGNRHRPDGVELRWRQLGVKGLISDPQLPYYIEWEDDALHPSVGAQTEVTIEQRCRSPATPTGCATGSACPPSTPPRSSTSTFVSPHGTPGLMAVTFDTPDGPVTI